jgi:hypothetical protein
MQYANDKTQEATVVGNPVYPTTVAVAQQESNPHHEEPAGEGGFCRTMSYLSNVYCYSIVLLAGVLKIAESLATKNNVRVDEFFMFLFIVGIIFVVYAFFYLEMSNQDRISETSNRWLKGAIVLFLICITAKDLVRSIEIQRQTGAGCIEKPLHITELWLFVFFAALQVVFVYRHGKVSITKNRIITRFGIMHMIATNLAVWINEIAEETKVAIHGEMHVMSDCSRTLDQMINVVGGANCTFLSSNRTANVPINWSPAPPHGGHQPHHVLLLYPGCPCMTTECTAVHNADLLLFPFLAEFCLVISCFMYEIYERIAKHAHHHESSGKPNYGLFGSYIGLACGIVTLIVMAILVGILFGGVVFGHYQIIIRDVFMIIMSLAMLAAVLYGFRLLAPLAKVDSEEMDLDMNLLAVCLTGPVLVALFTILSFHGLQAQPQSYADLTQATSHVFSLIFRVVDAIACSALVLFVSSGFERRGATAGMSDDTRVPIRNICLFLVLANACLWFFLSVEGSAFPFLSHEYNFYGHMSWTIITKLATPLEIFFRMHAAGCCFDIWSKM